MFAFMYPTLSTDPHTTCIGKISLGRKYEKDIEDFFFLTIFLFRKKTIFKAVVLNGFSNLRI